MSLPQTAEDFDPNRPAHRTLLRAIKALMDSRHLSQRDVVIPSDGSAPERWPTQWFEGEKAVERARAALNLYPDVEPQEAYRWASQWVGSDHPLPPFEQIYPET